jgi:hypothetical protein
MVVAVRQTGRLRAPGGAKTRRHATSHQRRARRTLPWPESIRVAAAVAATAP